MIKKKILLYIIISLFIGGFIYLNSSLQTPIINSTQYIKTYYLDKKSSIVNFIDEHFSQTERIKQLTLENEKHKQELIKLRLIAKEHKELLSENNSTHAAQTDISLTRAISYIRFADTNRVYIDAKNLEPNRAYGLIRHGVAAGIALLKDSRATALLNSDPKCTYSVYIGENMAPGIIRGSNSKHMIIDYIPTYIEIKNGDSVQTSGLDKIFPLGVSVGKVISISKVSGYQKAVVVPYYSSKNPTYFYMID